jgi:hypothetical protein
MKLSDGQAQYVLSALLSEGKLRVAQLRDVMKKREREIKSLRERLAALEKLSPAGLPRTRRRGGRAARRPVRKVRARRLRMSPRVRALRKLQGKYMGYVRRLKAAEKDRVRTVRENQGMDAAIRLAKSLAGKS